MIGSFAPLIDGEAAPGKVQSGVVPDAEGDVLQQLEFPRRFKKAVEDLLSKGMEFPLSFIFLHLHQPGASLAGRGLFAAGGRVPLPPLFLSRSSCWPDGYTTRERLVQSIRRVNERPGSCARSTPRPAGAAPLHRRLQDELSAGLPARAPHHAGAKLAAPSRPASSRGGGQNTVMSGRPRRHLAAAYDRDGGRVPPTVVPFTTWAAQSSGT